MNPLGGQKIIGTCAVTFMPQVLGLLPVVGATPQPVPVYSGALLLFQAQAPGGKVVSGVSRLSQRSWSRAPQWWPWYRVCTTVLQFAAQRLWSWLT